MSEVAVWSEYRKKRGSFNQSLRIEEGFARVQSDISVFYAKERVPAVKFMPNVVPPEAEKEADASEVFNLIKGLAKKTEGRNKYLARRAARK